MWTLSSARSKGSPAGPSPSSSSRRRWRSWPRSGSRIRAARRLCVRCTGSLRDERQSSLVSRKLCPHLRCHDSQTQPSSQAPTKSALTNQERARAKLAVWTWWMSQVMCLATSMQAPMTRRCRGASSLTGRSSGHCRCQAQDRNPLHFITFLCSTGQNSKCTSTRQWWGQCPGLLLLGALTLLSQTPGVGHDSLSFPNIPALSTAGKWTAISKLSPRIIPHWPFDLQVTGCLRRW
ncbi:hypothetical protein LEMLEM_LOCUS6588 [Lemmus lemmus]